MVNLVKEVEYLLVRLGLLEDLGPVLFLALLLVPRLQRIQRLHQFESFQAFASLGIGKMSLQYLRFRSIFSHHIVKEPAGQ